jgi:hypothetical protein
MRLRDNMINRNEVRSTQEIIQNRIQFKEIYLKEAQIRLKKN